MATASTIPIPSLDPNTVPPPHASIRAVVALSWPYSSATKQCSLLLSDPDFRLRSRKGQVRVNFTGPSAEAIAKSKLGVGDEVLLELRGGKWKEIETGGVQTPGKSVDGELVFGGKLGLRVLERAGVVGVEDEVEGAHGWIRVDEKTPPPDLQVTEEGAVQNKTPAMSRGRLADLRSSLGAGDGGAAVYASPAFARKFRLSGDDVGDLSASDPFIDAYWEEGSPRKKQRLSFTGIGKWRLEGRERSPEKGVPDAMDADLDDSIEPDLDDDASRDQSTDSATTNDALRVKSSQPMPPPRLQMPEAFVDAALAPVLSEAPSTPKLQPVPASNLPLPSPFPADDIQRLTEVQGPVTSTPKLVDNADQAVEPLSRLPISEVSQETTIPNTESQGSLNVPSQEIPSQPSLAFTESPPESSMPDMDSQNVTLETYAIGSRSVQDGTYRSQISNPELLSDTEEDENMYDDDLRDRADEHARDLLADNYDHDVIRDDDVEEVIDDMGEEPSSSDDEDAVDNDDDEDEGWEDDEGDDVPPASAENPPNAIALKQEPTMEHSTTDKALHEPDTGAIDNSGDDQDIQNPVTPVDTVSHAGPSVSEEQVAEAFKLVHEADAKSEPQGETAQFDSEKKASELYKDSSTEPSKVSQSAQLVRDESNINSISPASEQLAEPQAPEPSDPALDFEPLAAKAAQSTTVTKPPTEEQRPLPETPAKAVPGVFGREAVGSAVSTPKSTPQSERDRVMARTYSSLFGFGASKLAQPAFQTPTPNVDNVPKQILTGWGWDSLKKAQATEPPRMSSFGASRVMNLQVPNVGIEVSETLPPAPSWPPVPSEQIEQDNLHRPETIDQDYVMQASNMDRDALEDALFEAVVDATPKVTMIPEETVDVNVEADREDSPSGNVADVLPMPERLENIEPPASSAPRPTQPVQIIDLGSSDDEDEAGEDEGNVNATSEALPVQLAKDAGDGTDVKIVSEPTTNLTLLEYVEPGKTLSEEAEIMETRLESQVTGEPVAIESEDTVNLDEVARDSTLQADAVHDSTITQDARPEDLVKDAVQDIDADFVTQRESGHSPAGNTEVEETERLSDAEVLSPIAPISLQVVAYGATAADSLPQEASLSADERAAASQISESPQTNTTERFIAANQVTPRQTAASNDVQSPSVLLPTPQISELHSQDSTRTSANQGVLKTIPRPSQGHLLLSESRTNTANARPTTPEPLPRRTRATSRASSRASIEPLTAQPMTPIRRSTRKSQSQSKISEEPIDETAEDTIAVSTPSPKKTARRASANKPHTETSAREIKMGRESDAAHEQATPARKSITARLSTVPEAISAWFTPRRSARVHTSEEAFNSSQPHGLSTSLGYYNALSSLSQKLNPPSQSYADNTIDVLAIVTSATSSPERAKSGPRDYYITFRIWDRSLSSTPQDSILVEVFRPWHATLPVAEVGDGVLLRGFTVKSRKRNPYLLSTDASGWCVWRYGEEAVTAEKHTRSKGSFGAVGCAREEVKGPPVEVGREEREWVEELREKWVKSESGMQN